MCANCAIIEVSHCASLTVVYGRVVSRTAFLHIFSARGHDVVQNRSYPMTITQNGIKIMIRTNELAYRITSVFVIWFHVPNAGS